MNAHSDNILHIAPCRPRMRRPVESRRILPFRQTRKVKPWHPLVCLLVLVGGSLAFWVLFFFFLVVL